MHGMVNHSMQLFICHSHGLETWKTVMRTAGFDFVEFESMLSYKEEVTPAIIRAASEVLDRPRADLLEDFGTFIVSHPRFEAVRRLLRFGGEDFVDFLHSLDDLADSVRVAIADLHLPKVELDEISENQFLLECEASLEGYSYAMIGVLRAMADDYGALAVLEHTGSQDGVETISIMLVENDFAQGRSFDLAAGVG